MNNNFIDNNALSNIIREKITEEIVLGRIKPGEKLVESRFAEEFGTSRAPIREAFYLLTLDGLAQKIPRKGTVVKGYSVEEIKDVLEIRMFLEELAIKKANFNDIHSQIEKMEAILLEMEQNKFSTKKYAQLNKDFHYQIIISSNSHVIKNMYQRLGIILLTLQTVSFMEIENIESSISDHHKIINFLKKGDKEGARRLLYSHNHAVFHRIKKHLKFNEAKQDEGIN